MQRTIGQASGKLILSGEYAVVFGYPGVAIPAPFMVTATWMGSPSPLPLSRGEREMNIDGVSIQCAGIESEEYLHRVLNAIAAKTGPLHGHLTMRNTIPIGRGMGSSTALVIALCRCFLGGDPSQFPLPAGEGKGEGHIKEITLSIEDTVNPGHSGIDFAVMWENAPVLFQKGKKPYPLPPIPYHLESAVLIDTGKPNATTAEMIRWVKKNSLSQGERVRVRGALEAISRCTERLRAGESPLTVFPDHHRAQVALGVVPRAVQALIVDIEKAGGAAKVVGAGGRTGGGGIVLALHPYPAKLSEISQRHGLEIFVCL